MGRAMLMPCQIPIAATPRWRDGIGGARAAGCLRTARHLLNHKKPTRLSTAVIDRSAPPIIPRGIARFSLRSLPNPLSFCCPNGPDFNLPYAELCNTCTLFVHSSEVAIASQHSGHREKQATAGDMAYSIGPVAAVGGRCSQRYAGTASPASTQYTFSGVAGACRVRYPEQTDSSTSGRAISTNHCQSPKPPHQLSFPLITHTARSSTVLTVGLAVPNVIRFTLAQHHAMRTSALPATGQGYKLCLGPGP